MDANERIVRKAKRMGFYTGSRVFGGYVKGTSDIDIVVPPSFPYSLQDIIDSAEDAHYNPTEYRHCNTWSIYVPLRNMQYNLIMALSSETFDIWSRATEAMKAAILSSKELKGKVRLKEHRILLFECFRYVLGDDYLSIRGDFSHDDEGDDIPF